MARRRRRPSVFTLNDNILTAIDSDIAGIISNLDSEHAWNVAEHSKLDSDLSNLSSRIDSDYAWNTTEHQELTDRLDSAYAWNVAEHSALQSNLDSDIASEHAWNVAEHEKEITARQNADSDLDSDISTKVSKSGDTMTGDLTISNPNKLSANTIGSIGNSNLNIRRWNDTKIQITSSHNKQFQKAKYNADYGVDSDLEIPHKKYVDDAIDSAVANASFEFDSSQFVDATGDSMSGRLTIHRRNETDAALTVQKNNSGNKQSRFTVSPDGLVNWTVGASNARLNKVGGDLAISIDDVDYLKFDQSQGEIEVAKTLTLTAPDKAINLPNNSDTGQLQSNGNRRLFWDQNNVGIDVGLEMNAQINMNGGNGRNKIVNLATPTDDYHAANKKYVDDNAGGNAFIKNGDATTLTGHTQILSTGSKYINIQAAPNETQGFFVMRDNNSRNIMHVSNTGEIKLKSGIMASHLDEITTKRYVDSKVGGGRRTIGRRFKYNSTSDNYIYAGWFGWGPD